MLDKPLRLTENRLFRENAKSGVRENDEMGAVGRRYPTWLVVSFAVAACVTVASMAAVPFSPWFGSAKLAVTLAVVIAVGLLALSFIVEKAAHIRGRS